MFVIASRGGRHADGLVERLVAHGASVDGPNGDSAPLWTAIVWGYRATADALARAGARMDSLVLAAGAGNVERVKELLDGSHERLCIAGTDTWLEAEHMISYALLYAAGCNRRDVVERLLTREPDLSLTDPTHGASALALREVRASGRRTSARLSGDHRAAVGLTNRARRRAATARPGTPRPKPGCARRRDRIAASPVRWRHRARARRAEAARG